MRATVNANDVREKVQSVKHWYHQISVHPGIVTPGINDCAATLKLLNLPESCSGMRALDLGARDGFFSFEMEKRGAEVVAVDYMPCTATGFHVAATLLDSKVVYLQENIYNVTKAALGTFDIVLCLGLLYHLPDPMRALNVLWSVCRKQLYLETHVIDNGILMPDGTLVPLLSLGKGLEKIPLMQFFPGNSLNNDHTNYWGPNMRCMEEMLKESNFRVLERKLHGGRGLFKCEVTHDPMSEYHSSIALGKVLPSVG